MKGVDHRFGYRDGLRRLSLSEFKQMTGLPRPALAKPPRRKLFLLTWLGIYPLITALLWLFGPWLAALPLLLRTLLLTGVLVYAMTYGVMPLLTRLFQPWLQKP
jgi:antibiotic biosynthesis monooxygenase (ABM) superfamily enzyme